MVLPPIPTELHLTEAKLSKMTQAIAYKTIMRSKEVPVRPQTERMMKNIINCVKKFNRKSPNIKQVWRSFWSKGFSKLLKIFLWKCAHNAYKVGSYWDKANMKPELKEQQWCKHDGETDSINHILTECSCPGQKLVWEAVKDMWRKKDNH